MPHCIFMHKADSIYDDIPAERYQFPAMYLTRAEPCIGDWIVYLEPRKVRNSRGYFAVAKVEKIIPDPTAPGIFLALIEPGRNYPPSSLIVRTRGPFGASSASLASPGSDRSIGPL